MTDEEQLTEEFAWVHQAYAAIPATDPEVLGRAITAVVAEAGGNADAHNTIVTNVPRPARQMSWKRWSPWIALAASVCLVVALGEQWRRANRAKDQSIDALLEKGLLSSTASLRNHSGGAIGMRVPSTPLDATPSTAGPTDPSSAVASDPDAIDPTSQSPNGATSLGASRARAVEGLDPESATLVVSLLDNAQTRGLPIDGVVARIHEGVGRGVPPQQIVAVARNYVASLDNARTALGTSATVDELRAGAEALQAGAPPGALKQLRAARPSGSIVEPLIALADLSTHKVAPLEASTALSTLVARDGSDARVRALRAAVIADIIRGATPDTALAYRTQNNALK